MICRKVLGCCIVCLPNISVSFLCSWDDVTMEDFSCQSESAEMIEESSGNSHLQHFEEAFGFCFLSYIKLSIWENVVEKAQRFNRGHIFLFFFSCWLNVLHLTNLLYVGRHRRFLLMTTVKAICKHIFGVAAYSWREMFLYCLMYFSWIFLSCHALCFRENWLFWIKYSVQNKLHMFLWNVKWKKV